MTKQILAFLFCFIRELTLYSPLTLSLTPAREFKPYTPSLPYPSPPRANSNPLLPLTSIPNVCCPALAAVRLSCARALDTKGFTS